ncbi:MAG: DUF4136 domain-containing protein [Chitinophagaceae bacterium]|nr:MAG: DUF4136 domain-containing protein [Chitinophagaceae bacterium]
MRILLAGFLFLLSCSTAKVVKTDKVAGVNFQSFKTFGFYKLEATGDTSSKFDFYSSLLKQAIARELTAKGYTQTSSDPDLLVNLGVVVKEETQTRQTDIREAPRYIGQRRYTWKSEEVPVGQYKTGTATVDLVESKQNRMVWQGTLEGIIPGNRKTYEKEINKGVTALFAKFPD